MAVPDDIVIPLLMGRLAMADCVERGYVLDGYPRSVEQDHALKDAGLSYECAVMLHAPRTVLERRIAGRRVDPETGLLYNVRDRLPEEQEVLERLVPLAKDMRRNISSHLALYGRIATEMFDPITSTAVRIDADGEVDGVLANIATVLNARGFPPKQSQVIKSNAAAASASAAATGVASSLGGAGSDVPGSSVSNSDQRTGVDEVTAASVAAAAAAEAATPAGRELNGEQWRSRLDLPPDVDLDLLHVRESPAPLAPASKSPITLIRCDGYMCERESVDGSNIAFRGAATEQVMLVWNRRPSTVLLLSKKDPELMPSVLEAARHLIDKEGLRVIVEPQVQTEALANGLYLDSFTQNELLHRDVDFVICLGGDGLILHVSTLFKTAVPPVISFNLGSLGFLTPFDYENYSAEITEVLEGSVLLSLRMRLTCTILRDGKPAKEFEVLNEVVVDRGASPYLSNLDCFCDDKYITTVQADGIIMSTPTGSTAYSMSAGGSMVHPSVPAILFTPICPHSLSFRPIVFPDAAKLRIDIAEDARSHAWASFDGKFRQQLRRGDGLVVQMSLYPVPTVNKTDDTGDWFQSLDRAFNFNSRAIQKGLAEEMGPPSPPASPAKRPHEDESAASSSHATSGRPGTSATSVVTSPSASDDEDADYGKEE